MLFFRILADLVVLLHFSFVAFVVLGQVAILYGVIRRREWARSFYFRWLHLLAMGLVVVQSWLGLTCPLTDLENFFRERAGQLSYPGDFIPYWAGELLFYQGPPWVFVVGYTLFGALTLATFWLAPPRRPTLAAAR